MEYHSSKHRELAEQLTTWWGTQSAFKTKKELAADLNVHPDTLGDYFSGRKFPKSDIAAHLCQITDLACLRAVVDGAVSAKPPSLPQSAFGVAAPRETMPLPAHAADQPKHRELAQQLNSWWDLQSDYRTKKELAAVLSVHPDTLGDYFSGRKFPKSDIAIRLCELTDLPCLRAGSASTKGIGGTSLLPPIRSIVMNPPEKAAEPPAVKSEYQPLNMLQTTDKPKAEPVKRLPVIISLQRTTCPSCGKSITMFSNCTGCGQNFIWANLPLKPDEKAPQPPI